MVVMSLLLRVLLAITLLPEALLAPALLLEVLGFFEGTTGHGSGHDLMRWQCSVGFDTTILFVLVCYASNLVKTTITI
jgi:hypothetical protein